MTGLASLTAAGPAIAGGGSRALDWVRVNLFGGWLNGLLTVAALWLLAETVPPLARWLFVDAIWGAATPEACRAGGGACWAFVAEKYRLILFGAYPFAEQWRPVVAMALLISVASASARRAFWRPWLAGVWIAAVCIYVVLLGGGVFGLTPVRTGQWGGLALTLLLAVVGIVAAFPLAVLLALGRRSSLPVIRALSVAYIELIRGVPLITLLFMASFMLPLFLPTGVAIDAVLRAQITIIAFAAAYLAEVIRGGLQALPAGQAEAARALGLGYWQMQRMVILPQALRISIAPIVNTCLGMFKDTSLVAIIGLTDLLLAARQAFADPLWRPYFLEAYVFIGLIYWVFCHTLSRVSQRLERDLAAGPGAASP